MDAPTLISFEVAKTMAADPCPKCGNPFGFTSTFEQRGARELLRWGCGCGYGFESDCADAGHA